MTMKSSTKNRSEASTSPLDRRFKATFFKTQGAQDKIERDVSLRILEGRVHKAEADDKKHLPWFKGAVFGDVPTALRPHPTMPGKQTGNSLRNNANVLAVTGVEGDYDGESNGGSIQPEEARDRLKKAGITALVYTTSSHEPDAPRWRVFAPLSEAVPPAERYALTKRLNGLFNGDLDGSSFVLSQAYYYGSVAGRPAAKVFLVEGRRYLDEADDLDAGAMGKRQKSRDHADTGTAGAFNEAGLLDDIKTGANYHYSALALLGHWAAMGMGYLECRNRIREAFDAAPEKDRRPEWEERVKSIPEMLAYIFDKHVAEQFESRDHLIRIMERLADDAAGEPRGGSDEEDSESEDNAPELKVLTPDQCAVLPSAKHVIKGLIHQRDVASFVGPPGVGKSVIAPRLCYAVAQGEPVFNMRVAKGKVLYLACENERDMAKRVRALHEELGDAPDFHLVMDAAGKLKSKSFRRRLKALIAKLRPTLIVVDTLAAAFPGLLENANEGMGQAIAIIRELTTWGAAVLLIHHDTKAGDGLPRGHGSLHGDVDMNMSLKRDEATKTVIGRPSKNRNGQSHVNLLAYRNRVKSFGLDEDGDPITTVICEEVELSESRPATVKLTRGEVAALRILSDLLTESPEDVEGRRGVLRSVWRERCEAGFEVSTADLKASRTRAFNRALDVLHGASQIELIGEHVFLPEIRQDESFTDSDEDGGDDALD